MEMNSVHHRDGSSSSITLLTLFESAQYSRFQTEVYKIFSSITSFIFLSILMLFAIFKAIFNDLVRIFHNRNMVAMESLTEPEKRLVTHLSYYFTIHGLNLLEYKITTDDGFVITLQRISNPHELEAQKSNRKPILLLHGLLQSSGAFATSGPDNSLAFLLHNNGYDVWLGNNRCGFEPQHTFLSPNDPNMWNWDIYNMAMYDLPAMVDQIIQRTGYSKVSLAAHSQGTTQTFLALLTKNLKTYNTALDEKINCFVALAPAVFGGELLRTKLFIRFMNCLPNWMFKYFFGVLSFMPIMMHMRNVLVGHKIFGFLSYAMFNFLFDWDDSLWDHRYRTRHFIFSPVYISAKLMLWWMDNKNGFIANSTTIFDTESQWFDEKTPPIFLFIPECDKLVDCEQLVAHFKNREPTVRFQYKNLKKYAHLDVLWAKDVNTQIGEPMLEFLEEIWENQKES